MERPDGSNPFDQSGSASQVACSIYPAPSQNTDKVPRET